MIFDQGQGNDPDAGWVRVSPTNPSQVEFAVKRSILDAAPSFICWTWAGSDSLNPALFDLNDYFTQEQAGSSIYDYYYYPLNELSEIDNTCRIVIGNQTIQNSLGICETVPVPGDQPAGCRPPPQGCGPNEYFSDITCRCEIFG